MWVCELPWCGVAVAAEVEVDVGASGEVGRTDPGPPSICFVLVVVPVFGSTADEGEALSTAARPARFCSSVGRAGHTPAGCLSRAWVGNPRSFLRAVVPVLVEVLFIFNARERCVGCAAKDAFVKAFQFRRGMLGRPIFLWTTRRDPSSMAK